MYTLSLIDYENTLFVKYLSILHTFYPYNNTRMKGRFTQIKDLQSNNMFDFLMV